MTLKSDRETLDRTIEPETGMQREYLVLSDEELAKGYIRPLRCQYRHLVCGQKTWMAQKLAETYAVNPGFYSGTYCATCHGHFPVGPGGEFVWDDGTKVGT